MAGWNKVARQQAVQQAKELPPDALLRLVQHARRRLRRRRIQRWAFAGSYLLISGVACHFLRRTTGYPYWAKVDCIACFTIGWGLLLTFIPPLKVSLMEIFEDRQDAAFVPHLLALLAFYGNTNNLEVQKLESTLKFLLQQLRREQAETLSEEQRRTLARPLTEYLKPIEHRKVSPDLVMATLKALEQVGDRRELPLVERLANRDIWGEQDKAIQQAAQECLLYLQIRVEEQRQQTTLLRASDSVDNHSDALLRAAVGHAAAPEEQLLRPTMNSRE